MRQYEIAVVLHPDLEMDLERVSTKLEAIVTGLDGKIDKKEVWGKRKLAYKIRKQDWGVYVFYQVSLEPASVARLDGALRITDEVMRYLVTSLDEVQRIRPKSDKPRTQAKEDKQDEQPETNEAPAKGKE